MESAPPDTVELVCDVSEYAGKLTLYDSGNNVYESVIVCLPLNDPDPCAVFSRISSYSPAEWDSECP